MPRARALPRVASALGVPPEAGLSIWLLRLFFRAPAPGRPDWICLSARALARSASERLGIPPDAFWFDWVLRLFLKAPRAGRPDRLRNAIVAAVLSLSGRLGIRNVHSAREWTWRLFVRPPSRVSVWAALVHRCGILFLPSRWLIDALRAGFENILPASRRARCADAMEASVSRLGRFKPVMAILAVSGAGMMLLAATTPLSPTSQFAFFGVVLVLALLVRKIPGRLAMLMLVSFSLTASARYVWWRTTQTLEFPSVKEALVGYILYLAEGYTWLILLLGYLQTIWPFKRPVARLPEDAALWPSVDVFIPTYNEPLSVVKPAVYAAQGMDWPADRLKIYVLDDGKRPEFRAFAAEAGIGYITRDDNKGAKAGNINHALRQTRGEYVAIFDCDHVPVRSFLQSTMGALVADDKCALVQTPHYFFSPDPFQRNLGTAGTVPEEGSLFYGLVQDGNDLWNAAFFCGSCAVIRRAPLEQIGGIATETVTEDAHTSLRLHRLGYRSAYLSTVQAAGLATETLADHISQRIRWARGMAQIFRLDNPLFGRGLSLAQRLCYSNAMLHFFYGVPRLVFLLMPTAYLLFQLYFLDASALALAAFVLPHLVLANIASSRIQGRYRHSFWAEVYESVLAWYVVLPTTMAFLSPRHGKFNVTSKGQNIARGYRDWQVSLPYMTLATINVVAFGIGLGRYFYWNVNDSSTVLINLFWTAYNLIMLGVAISVSREARQARGSHRTPTHMPASLVLADGHVLACETFDYSTGGLGLKLPRAPSLDVGAPVGIGLGHGSRELYFPARVARVSEGEIGVAFDALTLAQERDLVQCTFGRADAWLDRGVEAAPERILASMLGVIRTSVIGYVRLARDTARACWLLFVPGRGRASRH